MQRATVLALGFGLRMEAKDVSEFLTKAIQEADFDEDDPWEMICRFCFENGLPYARAVALMEEYKGFPAGRDIKTEVEPLPEGSSEARLRTGSGNLQKMSQSMLNRQFQQRRLTRQRLDSLIKGELAIERFDLITLGFMVASQREDEDPPERLRRYMDDMNAALARCDMMKLYPVNPYEAFTMMCLLAEMPLLTYYDVWEMSYDG